MSVRLRSVRNKPLTLRPKIFSVSTSHESIEGDSAGIRCIISRVDPSTKPKSNTLSPSYAAMTFASQRNMIRNHPCAH